MGMQAYINKKKALGLNGKSMRNTLYAILDENFKIICNTFKKSLKYILDKGR